MTKQELNRDIKRLEKAIFKKSQIIDKTGSNDEYFKFISEVATPEFTRLFRADDEMEAMTKESIKIMLRLNLRHRFVPFHCFGICIDLPSEKK